MRFFDRQKQKKVYRELAALRKDEDDLLAIEEKQEFDAILAELKNSPDPRDAVAVARRKMTDFPLHGNYGTLRNLLDLLLVVGAVAFGLRALFSLLSSFLCGFAANPGAKQKRRSRSRRRAYKRGRT